MGVLSASGSPLVAGSASTPMSEKVYIKVVRAFYADRVVQPVGTIIEVPKHVAAGLIASGKASAAEKPAPAAPAATDEPPPAPLKRKRKDALK